MYLRFSTRRIAMVRVTQAAAVMALACAVPASGQAPAHGLRGSQPAKPSHVPRPPAPALEPAGRDARAVMAWIVASGDNRGLPYMVIDKVDARVFAFDAQGAPRGTAPALLGLGRGDDSAPGIGTRKLATITPAERTTPAGRFEAALGFDLEQDVLWIDYDAALSMHRVIVGNPADHRRARLASPSPGDNRISYGCINVPARFYDTVVAPLFKGTVGIVYILPETRSIEAAFAMNGEPPPIAPIR